jgi:hypothetical protein
MPTDNTFYENCPKLSDVQSEDLEKELTLNDLIEALSTCKESAPGPDGIPYIVYKKYWNLMGPIIHSAWKHSIKIGKMPPSHLESVITLLPKEGKDNKDIKNWRPITLSNCDAKIITKALSLKTGKTLESIIDVSQTAYVPGRSITDNLRSNFFFKNYCNKKNIDSVLISLDAKKAFDSVSHKYIEETLEAYGFGPNFLKTFKLLYSEITAKILINGFFSESIKIERGVKQGDALSCALFIICIDPLLRNINAKKQIRGIEITSKNKVNKHIKFKGAAYADDISVICKKRSIQMVFDEYQRLTNRSGLELNADKTEILILNKNDTEEINIRYNKKEFVIKTVDKLKICGLFFCSEGENEYNLNVHEKIKKLNYKIKSWIPRHLTMEGKTLIVKTFGLSQIIYNMQSYEFHTEEIKSIEKLIFKFLWSTSENHNGIDRVKRSIMKNEYSKGGMKVTDVECLNCSLKLKQFIRANNTNHAISRIQAHLTVGPEELPQILQEYSVITEDESICRSAQLSINTICDYNRKQYNNIPEEKFESNKILINEVSSINLTQYLSRRKMVFMQCMVKNITKDGIETLGELIQTYEYEIDVRSLKTMKMILAVFPTKLRNIAECYIEGINSNNESLHYIMTNCDTWKDINLLTVKEMQAMMKTILMKTEKLDFEAKHGILNFDEENINNVRKNCPNAKLRNIYFRLIHNDFYTYEKMKKYKMQESDSCPRCGNKENLKHLIWDCDHSSKIWNCLNQIFRESDPNNESDLVGKYENIFEACKNPSYTIIKLKIIQEIIQIVRPKNWNKDKVVQVIKSLWSTEKFNAIRYKNESKFNKTWKQFDYLNQR